MRGDAACWQRKDGVAGKRYMKKPVKACARSWIEMLTEAVGLPTTLQRAANTALLIAGARRMRSWSHGGQRSPREPVGCNPAAIQSAINAAAEEGANATEELTPWDLATLIWAAVAQIATTTSLRGIALALTSASKDECCACIPAAR